MHLMDKRPLRLDKRPYVDKIRNPYLYWLSQVLPLEIARIIIGFMPVTPGLTIRPPGAVPGQFPYWVNSLEAPIRIPDPLPNWAEGYTPGRRFMTPSGFMSLW